ncbi:MAG: hypothetical protein WA547_02525 [Thermoplasmata archaeon]
MPDVGSVQELGVIGFDLRSLSPADVTWKRSGLVLVLAILVAVGVELAALLWSERTTLSARLWETAAGEVEVALILAMIGFLSLGVAGIPRLLPGAEKLTIDQAGVHLFYQNATREDFPWRDRRGFLIRDYTDFPNMVREGRAFNLRGPQFRRRRTLLTRGAFEAILEEARARGAEISTRRGGTSWRGPVPSTYRVRAPA